MTTARDLLQFLNWMRKVKQTGKLILCWITRNFRKADPVSSNTCCLLPGCGSEEDRWTEDIAGCKEFCKNTGTERKSLSVITLLFMLLSEEHITDAIYSRFIAAYLHTDLILCMSSAYAAAARAVDTLPSVGDY